MVFSDSQIRLAIRTGRIVIFPLSPENIRGSSVDVRLGRYYYTADGIDNGVAYNSRSPSDVEKYFRLYEAKPHHDACADLGIVPYANIDERNLIIVLEPGQRILAHTHEFIGINPPGTSEMRARSSTGRNGIVVCMCAGWGDPGYINRWTMEILNVNRHRAVLVVGERIAQIVFHETGPVDRHYGSDGKYQSGTDLAQLVASWRPGMMLPRAHTDLTVPIAEPTVETVAEHLIEFRPNPQSTRE